jgi:hypothetical protein
MKLTHEARLQLANLWLSGDVAADAETVAAGIKPASDDDAMAFAGLLGNLYRLIHPGVSSCPHDNWEAENWRDYAAAEAAGEFRAEERKAEW